MTAHELGHIYGLGDEYCSNQAGSTDSRCNDGDSQGDGATTGDVNWLDAAYRATVHPMDPMIRAARHAAISEDLVAPP